jgi:hypothetical protein
MRQLIFYPSGDVPAMNMKFRIELSLGQEIAIYAAERMPRHFSVDIGAATAALRPRCSLQGESIGLAVGDDDC